MNVKDEVIWNLLEEKKIIGEKLWNNFYKEATEEVEEWGRLKEKVEDEISHFELSCGKCHCRLDEETINENCPEDGEGHYFQK